GSIAGRIVIEPSSTPNKCAIKGDPIENRTSGQIQEQTGHRPNVEEILLIAGRVSADQREQMSRFSRREGVASPPNEKGEFTLKTLEAGRYNIMADLPDGGWRIRAITKSVAGTVKQSGVAGVAGAAGEATAGPKSPVEVSRDGVTIKPGEKLSGVEVIVVED